MSGSGDFPEKTTSVSYDSERRLSTHATSNYR